MWDSSLCPLSKALSRGVRILLEHRQMQFPDRCPWNAPHFYSAAVNTVPSVGPGPRLSALQAAGRAPDWGPGGEGVGRLLMSDIVDSKRRSAMMARVRGRDTAPELAVRRIAHRMGLRFRLHRKDLPGRPDLVFPKHRLAVFVHGCFWHRHKDCRHASTPKTRVAFWDGKFAANVARDARQEAALTRIGWRVLVIWQCETKDEAGVERRLAASVDRGRPTAERASAAPVAMVESRCSTPAPLSSELDGADTDSRAGGSLRRSPGAPTGPALVTR